VLTFEKSKLCQLIVALTMASGPLDFSRRSTKGKVLLVCHDKEFFLSKKSRSNDEISMKEYWRCPCGCTLTMELNLTDPLYIANPDGRAGYHNLIVGEHDDDCVTSAASIAMRTAVAAVLAQADDLVPLALAHENVLRGLQVTNPDLAVDFPLVRTLQAQYSRRASKFAPRVPNKEHLNELVIPGDFSETLASGSDNSTHSFLRHQRSFNDPDGVSLCTILIFGTITFFTR
jgi:hypothetical protein